MGYEIISKLGNRQARRFRNLLIISDGTFFVEAASKLHGSTEGPSLFCAIRVGETSLRPCLGRCRPRALSKKEQRQRGEGGREEKKKEGKERRRKGEEKKRGEREGGEGKEKRRGEKEKEERGRKKKASTISQQVGPQLPLGSMPSAQGGSTTFLEGPSGRIQKKLGCSPVSDGQKGAPPENGFRFLALDNKSKGRKFSSEI